MVRCIGVDSLIRAAVSELGRLVAIELLLLRLPLDREGPDDLADEVGARA